MAGFRSRKPANTKSRARTAQKRVIYLNKSNKPGKKYMATMGNKTVHFGAKGMSDFTLHKDPVRKSRYIARHKSRENHGSSGVGTPGWLSRWILWNKPSLTASIKDAEKRFNVRILRARPPANKSRAKTRSKRSR